MNSEKKSLINRIGISRFIIIVFFILLLLSSIPLGLSMPGLLSDVIRRWAMYGILVLAMVPAVQSGIGLNFGISLGIVAGLLGATLSVQIGFANPLASLLFAILVGSILASFLGTGYGLLLNKVKGSEMTVSTYVGFSVIALMNIVWLSLPFTSGELIWPLGGQGMRQNISLASSYSGVLNKFLAIKAGDELTGFNIPTGLILFFLFACVIVWLFMRSKAGMAMTAAGANPTFTRSSGIDVDKMRILGTAISTVLGAIGIVVYSQSYGFLQLYNAPLMMGFHCVAAVLIGGASVSQAKISHVILGTFLFQGILAVALPVANMVLPEGNLSEVVRIIISNGIILYALSKAKGGSK